MSQFVRQSGRYPLCGKGDVNTYALFAEHNRDVIGPRGRAGFIVPTGIATDKTTKEYFGALMSHRHVDRDQLEAVGVSESMLRLSVGLESVNDLIADLDRSLSV